MIGRIAKAIEARRYRFLNARKQEIGLLPGAVSFTFDDFPESASTAASLLEQRGWRGTFYLAPALAGRDSAVGPIATVDSAANLFAAGHEIGNHTNSHLRCNGAKKSEVRRDISDSRPPLIPMNGNRSFAFPYGAYDDASLNQLSGRFDTLRTVQNGVNRGLTDLNLLKANPVYRTMHIDSIAALVDDVALNGGWLIFYTHDVCPQPSAFGCTADQFAQVLDVVAARGLSVGTMADVYSRL